VKPTRRELVEWIRDSVNQIEMSEGVFLNVVLRNPEEIQKYVSQNQLQEGDEEMQEEGQQEDEYELIHDNDYDFDTLS